MSVERPVAEVLAAIATAMRRNGLRWYLFGAQAAIIWGRPRFSVDVDITAVIGRSDLDAFLAAMETQGFLLLTRKFLADRRVLPFVHSKSNVPLDVVVAGPGLEEQFLDRAIGVDISGTVIPVISPEDLIVTKIIAGRPKDIEDVRGVLQERLDSLDLERVRSLLHLIEQALSQSDLVSTLERQIERLR